MVVEATPPAPWSLLRLRLPLAALGIAALVLLLSSPLTLVAQEHQEEAFTEARFAELQEGEALILVDVFADWCPTCAIQQEVLAAFRADHPEVPLHTLTVDFDPQKEWVRHFGAPRQSTLILFRGDERIWFSVAETRSEIIREELLSAAAGS